MALNVVATRDGPWVPELLPPTALSWVSVWALVCTGTTGPCSCLGSHGSRSAGFPGTCQGQRDASSRSILLHRVMEGPDSGRGAATSLLWGFGAGGEAVVAVERAGGMPLQVCGV